MADHDVDTFVIGQQLAVERSSQATAESFVLVGPLIVLVVVGLLALSYRDPVDVGLAALGIALTFVWLVGGWKCARTAGLRISSMTSRWCGDGR